VLNKGGEVYLAPARELPGEATVAAILRY
jgi:hypothetical protein